MSPALPLLFALLACPAPAEPDPEAQARALIEPGPYGVSYTLRTLTWQTPQGPRELHLAAWAPSDPPNRGVDYRDLIDSEDATRDAPIAAGSFPVAVFSHGHQGYAEVSSFLMEHLASHGWVVLAPDHTDNTLFDGADRATEIYWQRPMDLSAVLDWAEAPGDDPLAGHVGEGAVVLGHSFGGYTVHALGGAAYDPARLAECAAGGDDSPFCSTWSADNAAIFEAGLGDPRVLALVSMAAGDFDLFGAEGLGAVQAPVLQLTGTEDPGQGDALWEVFGRPGSLRVVLDGGGHQGFTDYAGNLEPTATLEPEEGWRIVRAYTLAFALRALGDERGALLLDGGVEVSPAAALTPGG